MRRRPIARRWGWCGPNRSGGFSSGGSPTRSIEPAAERPVAPARVRRPHGLRYGRYAVQHRGPSRARRPDRIIVLFNSYQFTFGFLPAALLIFGLLARSGRLGATAWFTILASLFFYGWWNWHYLFLFGFSVGFNYLWSLLLIPANGAAEEERSRRVRRMLLGVGVAVNLAL